MDFLVIMIVHSADERKTNTLSTIKEITSRQKLRRPFLNPSSIILLIKGKFFPKEYIKSQKELYGEVDKETHQNLIVRFIPDPDQLLDTKASMFPHRVPAASQIT